MAVSKRLRYEVLRRDNHACRYCGATAPDAKLTVDHVIPTALGGGDQPDNLATACADCNNGKSASPADAALVEDVAAKALEWKTYVQAASNYLHAQRDEEISFVGSFGEIWHENCRWSIPHTWENSAAAMYRAGATLEDVRYAALVTASTSGVTYHWSYFCGVIWRHLKRRDELAQQWMQEASEEAGN